MRTNYIKKNKKPQLKSRNRSQNTTQQAIINTHKTAKKHPPSITENHYDDTTNPYLPHAIWDNKH